jgi:hypothetical protein
MADRLLGSRKVKCRSQSSPMIHTTVLFRRKVESISQVHCSADHSVAFVCLHLCSATSITVSRCAPTPEKFPDSCSARMVLTESASARPMGGVLLSIGDHALSIRGPSASLEFQFGNPLVPSSCNYASCPWISSAAR